MGGLASFMCLVFSLGSIGVLCLVIVGLLQRTAIDAESHWYQLIDGLQYSTDSFYAELEREIDLWKIPSGNKARVEHAEGHALFSGKRLYLSVTRDDMVFDICAAAFGRGFFVSWWLVRPGTLLERLARIPYFGVPFRPLCPPPTYYRIDTMLMFQDVVHTAVLKVLDDLIKVNNLKELTSEQRKPIMKEFFKR